MYLTLAGWRHGTKRGAWAPLVDSIKVLLISSPTLQCWWYLHLRVHQPQPGDLAQQEEDLVTAELILADCRHAIVRHWGGGAGWFIILLIL